MSLTGLCKNVLRLPLVPVSEKVEEEINAELGMRNAELQINK